MILTPRPYQLAAAAAINAGLADGGTGLLAVLPTGSGKTILLADLIHQWMVNWPETRVCVLAHTKELVEQNAAKFAAYWQQQQQVPAPMGIYCAGLRKKDTDASVLFASIQSVTKKAMQLGAFDVLMIDEAHHIPTERDEGIWRRFIADATRANPNVRIVGLSATPYRLGSGSIVGETTILKRICYEISVLELIQQGHLCPLVTKASAVQADTSGLHTRQGEYIAAEVESLMDQDNLIAGAVQEMITQGADRKSWIVFCAGVVHADHVRLALCEAGIPAGIVTGETPRQERDRTIADFKAGRLRALCNVNVLSEGFDHPGIDLVALLRPTKSAGLYYQQCLDSLTEILTRTGWKKIGEVSEHDEVAATDYRSEVPRISWETPIQVVNRPLGDESMFHAVGPGIDIRVTAGHAMILKSQTEKAWKRKSAEDVSKRLSGYKIPVAAFELVDPAPLTDDEIRFIGWFMTDGNRNKITNAITISQSEKQPWFGEIEKMLVGCGFKYSKRLITAKTNFKESGPRYTFIVSRGLPRATDKHLSGWERLERWLDKDFSTELDALDDRQFEVLLQAMHLGDGAKQASVSWTRRSYHIVTVNSCFADRVQSLSVRRGWRCNIGKSHSRGSVLLTLHIKKQAYRSVAGIAQKDRGSALRLSDSTPSERVWCVTVPSGAFIARRNGKAFVTGNCGRAFRISPVKQDALILDFAGVIAEHGPVDQIKVTRKEKSDVPGEMPTKDCPECGETLHLSAMRCPVCGYEFPAKPKHDAEAADAAILSSQLRPVRHTITDVRYSRHVGGSGIPTLRADYYAGYSRVAQEWVCIEHTGYAKAKALQWLTLRYPRGFSHAPGTVDQLLDWIKGGFYLTQPTAIHLRPGNNNKKYPEIVRYEWPDLTLELAA